MKNKNLMGVGLTVILLGIGFPGFPATRSADQRPLPLVTEAMKERTRVLFIDGQGPLYTYPDLSFLERQTALRFIFQRNPAGGEDDLAGITDGHLWDTAQLTVKNADRQNELRQVLARRRFDLVVLQARKLPADIQETLIRYVKEGGTLVWLGKDAPPQSPPEAVEKPENDPLWKLCPWIKESPENSKKQHDALVQHRNECSSRKQVYRDQGVVADAVHPLTCGMPFDRMLTTGFLEQDNRLRPTVVPLVSWQIEGHAVLGVMPLDQGEVLGVAVPMTGYRSESATVDQDFLWARFWDQLGRYAKDRKGAYPCQVSVAVSPSATKAGEEIKVRIKLINRGSPAGQPARLDLNLDDVRGRHVADKAMEAKVGQDATTSLKIPADACSGAYRVGVTLRMKDQVVHQGFAFVDVKGRIDVALSSDQYGYQVGEKAVFKAAITSAGSQKATVHFVVRDVMGIPVHHEQAGLTLEAGRESQSTFTWVMPDYGTEGWAFRGEVQVAGAGCAATATQAFWRYQPWTFREKMLVNSWWEAPPSILGALYYRGIGLNATMWGEPAASRFNMRNWNQMNTTMMEQSTGDFSTPDFSHLLAITNQTQIAYAPYHSAATVLHDYGEETGFYYHWSNNPFGEPLPGEGGADRKWRKDEQIPPGAHRLFQLYLKEKYGTVDQLNAAWETRLASFQEARLSCKYGLPSGWLYLPPPKDVPDNLARYIDTHGFFFWYVPQVGDAFIAGINKLNPTPTWGMSFSLTFNVFSPVPMTLAHPSYHAASLVAWNNHARARSKGGNTPFFSFQWGFDEDYPTWGQFWNQSLAFHSTLLTSWGSLFNYDLTHSRSTVYLKRLMAQVRPREKFFLDLNPVANDDVGFYHPDLDWQQVHSRPGFFLKGQGKESQLMGQLGYKPTGTGWLGGPEFQIFNVINNSGYTPRYVTEDEIAKCRVLVVPYVETLPVSAARKIEQFVNRGGTLITMPVLATHDGNGKPYRDEVPGGGLAKVLGLTLAPPMVGQRSVVTLPSDDQELPMRFTPRVGSEPPYLWLFAYQNVPTIAADTHVAVRNCDGVPFLTVHPYGRGRAIHINAFTFGHFAQYEDSPCQVESLRQLFDNLIRSAGVKPYLFVENPYGYGIGVQEWAQYQYQLKDSAIRVLAVYSDRTSPPIAAQVVLTGEAYEVYDILKGRRVPLQYRVGGKIVEELDPFAFTKSQKAGVSAGITFPVELNAGDVSFYAIVPYRTGGLDLRVTPAEIVAGQNAVELTVQALGDDGRVCAEGRPVEIVVMDGQGIRQPMLCRRVTAKGKTTLTIPTRLGDPEGTWTVRAVDGVTGKLAEQPVKVRAHPAMKTIPVVEDLEFSSQEPRPIAVSDAEFTRLLDALREVYLTGGLKDKGSLSYYCHERDISRHRILQLLGQVDWRAKVKLIKQYVGAGNTLILAGEDLGIDPATGLALDPLTQAQDDSMDMATGGPLPGVEGPHIREALESLCGKGTWERLFNQSFSENGVVIPIGKGRVILDKVSLDDLGQQNGQFLLNHQRWLEKIGSLGKTGRIP